MQVNVEIKSLLLKNVRTFKGIHEFDLKKLNIFTGPNNSGKSTILKVMEILGGISENPFNNSLPELKSLRTYGEKDIQIGVKVAITVYLGVKDIYDIDRYSGFLSIDRPAYFIDKSIEELVHYYLSSGFKRLQPNYINEKANKHELKDGYKLTNIELYYWLESEDEFCISTTLKPLVEGGTYLRKYEARNHYPGDDENSVTYEEEVEIKGDWSILWCNEIVNAIPKEILETKGVFRSLFGLREGLMFGGRYEIYWKEIIQSIHGSIITMFKTPTIGFQDFIPRKVWCGEYDKSWYYQQISDIVRWNHVETKKYKSLWLQNIGYRNEIEIEDKGNGIYIVNLFDKEGNKTNVADIGSGYAKLVWLVLALGRWYDSDILEMLERKERGEKLNEWEENEVNWLDMSGNRNSLKLVEPEAGLHPKLQSLLADLLFIHANDLYYGSNPRLFVETHSEYLIRRLQYLVATGKAKAEDVVIYYIADNEDEGEKVRKITLNEKGQLSQDFGTGFLDESTNLMMELFKQNTQT